MNQENERFQKILKIRRKIFPSFPRYLGLLRLRNFIFRNSDFFVLLGT